MAEKRVGYFDTVFKICSTRSIINRLAQAPLPDLIEKVENINSYGQYEFTSISTFCHVGDVVAEVSTSLAGTHNQKLETQKKRATAQL